MNCKPQSDLSILLVHVLILRKRVKFTPLKIVKKKLFIFSCANNGNHCTNSPITVNTEPIDEQ